MAYTRETWNALVALCFTAAAVTYFFGPIPVGEWLWFGLLLFAMPRLADWVDSRRDRGDEDQPL